MKIKNLTAIISAAALVTSPVLADTTAINNVIAANPENAAESMMVPVRKVCEALGMTVEWSEEKQEVTLKTDSLTISFAPNKDAYSINGAQSVQLGIKPVLKYDTTYVPFDFVSKILNLPVSQEPTGEAAVSRVIVLENNEASLLVYDFNHGDVNVNITDETVISDAQGNKTDVKKLTKGNIIDVEYAPFMTASLPPMTNAVKITTLASLKADAPQTPSEEKITNEAVYLSNEDGMYLLYDLNLGKVNINVTENTVVKDENGDSFDIAKLEIGQTLSVVYDDVMTKSLPPMTNALEITVKSGESKTVAEGAVVSVEKDGELVQIIIGDKEDVRKQIALNVDEALKISFLNGDTATIDDIEEGMKLTAVVSAASTKSIPQQKTVFNIVLSR